MMKGFTVNILQNKSIIFYVFGVNLKVIYVNPVFNDYPRQADL